MDNREVARHLLSEIEALHERMAHLEKGLELGIYDRLKHSLSGGEKDMSQRAVLGVLERFDKGASATSASTFDFTLKGKKYTITLNGDKSGLTVQSPDGHQTAFAGLDTLKPWLEAQKGVLSAGAPEGSRLLAYTQAVLAQQGARQASAY